MSVEDTIGSDIVKKHSFINEKISVNINNSPVFREWAPLNRLLDKIPLKYQCGFIPKDIVLTCVAVSCDSIVLGSDAGFLFWFQRSSEQLTRAKSGFGFIKITALSLTLSQYGEALAVGNSQGSVEIFCSNVSQVSPVCNLQATSSSSITSLAWDGCGIFLLIGTNNGEVLLSQFHRNSHTIVRVITKELVSIIQLRFHPLDYKTVLISTLQRVLIASIGDQVEINQIGQQERKGLAPFGADFGYSGNETVIIGSRPGLRLWICNCQGAVQQTLLFKDIIPMQRPKMILLSFREEHTGNEIQFGPVYCLINGMIVTFSPSNFFILDIGQYSSVNQISIVSNCRLGLKNLSSASVFHNEIFLLLGHRTLVRISDRPDNYGIKVERPFTTWREALSSDLTRSTKPFHSAISKIANKITDVDLNQIKPRLVPGLNHGPLLLESLSNAIVPLFDSRLDQKGDTTPLEKKSNRQSTHLAHTFVDHSFRPKRSQASVKYPISSEARGCNYNVLEEQSSSWDPTYCSDSSEVVESKLHATNEGAELLLSSSDVSLDSEVKSPYDNISCCPLNNSKTPEVASNETLAAEEELVYASYVGRKKKIKFGRKGILSSSGAESSFESTAFADPIELSHKDPNSLTSRQVPYDLEEELNRKDQLLAQILQLDQPIDVPPVVEDTRSCFVTFASHTNRSESESLQVLEHSTHEELPSDVCSIEDIYKKYKDSRLEEDNGLFSISPLSNQAEESQNGIFTLNRHSKWISYPLPGTQSITDMISCEHYLAIIDGGKSVFFQPASTKFPTCEWKNCDTPATKLCASRSGRRLLRIYKNIVYVGLEVNLNSPTASDWCEIANNVSSVGITELGEAEGKAFIWILYCDGTLSCRSWSSDFSEIVDVEWNIARLCCHQNQVWVVSSEGSVCCRIGISLTFPIGLGWKQIPAPERVISLAFNSNQAWILTSSESLYFTDFNCSPTIWWRVLLTEDILSKPVKWLSVTSLFRRSLPQPQVTVTNTRVYLSYSTCRILTSDQITGYVWRLFEPLKKKNSNSIYPSWKLFSANGLYCNNGVLWLIDDNGRLHSCYNKILEQVCLPTDEEIIQLASAPQHLWLLTEQSRIFLRASSPNPVGSGWVELSNLQFSDQNPLVHVSLGSDLAWACDLKGQVYFRVGNNGPPILLAPAWVPVDETVVKFKQVCVGTSNFIVWGLDVEGDVYVREGVYADFPIGMAWLIVPGVKAVQLTISECAVWVLTADGSIFRRCGISRNNFSGDAWERIPGSYSYISVAVDDELWSLDSSGHLYCLNTSSPFSSTKFELGDNLVDTEDEWILL